jgi:hypothetical protein
MSASRAPTLLVLLLAAAANAAAPPGNLDRYGDPLPPRAPARFGSLRYRFIQESLFVHLSPDARTLVEGPRQSRRLNLRDAGASRLLRSIGLPGNAEGPVAFVPPGDRLLVAVAEQPLTAYEFG